MHSRLTPSPATAIASLALFISLAGGAAYAASHLINGSQIKKNSIPANRIVKGSLTGTQIKVSSLPTVPSATHATAANHATSADTLGGQPASAFAPASRVQVSGNIVVPNDGQPHKVFSRAPLTWNATCTGNSSGASLDVHVVSSEVANFTQVGNTGASVPTTPPGLGVWGFGGSGPNYTTTSYAVLGQDGAQYQGTFSVGLHINGNPCVFSVISAG